MAKSPVGGSRSLLKGRIGSDVYSVGKDGKGKRQQVVRSLAEQVTNPRTSSQMFTRMVMSTVMQAAKALNPIIDHSFDGTPVGQPSISEFIRRNFALVKADAIAHPTAGFGFGLNQYQEKGMKFGYYVISSGKAQFPAAFAVGNFESSITLTVGATLTYGALKAAWGLSSEEYVTIVSFKEKVENMTDGVCSLLYCRLSIKPNLNASTVLTAANFLDAFNIDSNFTPKVALTDGVITLSNGDDNSVFYGMQSAIVTRKHNGKYIHSSLTVSGSLAKKYSADVALPTYPVGSEQFLNGGDL